MNSDDGNGKDGGKEDEEEEEDRPVQWLSRQMAADRNLDVITTVYNEVLRLQRFKTFSDTKEIVGIIKAPTYLRAKTKLTKCLINLAAISYLPISEMR